MEHVNFLLGLQIDGRCVRTLDIRPGGDHTSTCGSSSGYLIRRDCVGLLRRLFSGKGGRAHGLGEIGQFIYLSRFDCAGPRWKDEGLSPCAWDWK